MALVLGRFFRRGVRELAVLENFPLSTNICRCQTALPSFRMTSYNLHAQAASIAQSIHVASAKQSPHVAFTTGQTLRPVTSGRPWGQFYRFDACVHPATGALSAIPWEERRGGLRGNSFQM